MPDAVDELIRKLGSREPGRKSDVARQSAALVLGMSGDARAIEPLCRALADSDFDVQESAAAALIRIGSPAVESLCRALEDWSHGGRRHAVEVLGNICDAHAVESLCHALEDPDYDVRCSAADALCAIGDTRGLGPLCRALGSTGDGSQRVARAIATFGPAAVPPLCEALEDSDYRVRQSAGYALGCIRDARAVEPLCRALADAADDVRISAAAALREISDARSIGPLCRALGDANGDVRQYAATALSKIGAPAVAALCQAQGKTDEQIRRHAAEALGTIGGRDDLPRKILIAEQMTLQERMAALKALRACYAQYLQGGRYHPYRTPDMRRLCEPLLVDKDRRIRQAARQTLNYLDNDLVVPAASSTVATEREQLVRMAVEPLLPPSGADHLRAAEAPTPEQQPPESGKRPLKLLSRLRGFFS